MPYLNGVPKPEEQLEELMRGRVAWGGAPEAIRSWAMRYIYAAACQVLAEPEKGNRRNMLGRIPASVRPHVEAEAMRLHALRKKLGGASHTAPATPTSTTN